MKMTITLALVAVAGVAMGYNFRSEMAMPPPSTHALAASVALTNASSLAINLALLDPDNMPTNYASLECTNSVSAGATNFAVVLTNLAADTTNFARTLSTNLSMASTNFARLTCTNIALATTNFVFVSTNFTATNFALVTTNFASTNFALALTNFAVALTNMADPTNYAFHLTATNLAVTTNALVLCPSNDIRIAVTNALALN